MRTPHYFQVDCKSAVKNALLRGIKRQLVVMPGGTGKTKTAVDIINDIGGRTCWVAASEELLDQAAFSLITELDLMPQDTLTGVFDLYEGSIVDLLKCKKGIYEVLQIQAQIGIIKAESFDIQKPFVLASAQTLYKRLDKIPEEWFKVIVVDEADLYFSATFKKPLEYFKFDLLLGLTATPFRADGVLMDDIFEETVYEYEIGQAIKDGFLCELNAIVVKTTTNLDDVHTKSGDFVEGELSVKVNTPERNNRIVSKYIEHCSGQQFIAFTCDVQHAIDLHDTFNERGIKTEFVVSDKNLTLDRKGIVKRYRNGDITGLVNITIFAAGFDAPNTGCVILARPTKSKRLFLQELFRVTRLKNAAFVAKFGQIGTILDIVDGTSKHNLINTHELDKELPIEDRVFTSSANKQKLIDARNERMMEPVKNDKQIQLFRIPKHRVVFGDQSHDPLEPGQRMWLKANKYDVDNITYTRHQFLTIYMASAAPASDVAFLKENGYAVNGHITNGSAQLARIEIAARAAKANTIRLQKEGKL